MYGNDYDAVVKFTNDLAIKEYNDLLPNYPKRDTFTKEEQKRIAMVPKRLKDWAVGVIKYSNCVKYEICNTKND